MKIKTYIVDAFTDQPFKGNPAGVCIIENYFSHVICYVLFHRVATNVLQLGEVADLEALTFNLALNPPFCQTAVSGWHFYLKFRFVNSS